VDAQQFKVLSDKMDAIIKLLALNALEGKQLKNQVLILSSFGFQPKQIADMLGKTPNHIRVLLHELRKGESQKEGEGGKNQTSQTQGEPNA